MMDDPELALERAIEQVRSESPELQNSVYSSAGSGDSCTEDSVYSSTGRGLAMLKMQPCSSPRNKSASSFSGCGLADSYSSMATFGNADSAMSCHQAGPYMTATQLAVAKATGFLSSDVRVHSCSPQGEPVNREEVFFWSVRERLLAVSKDRENMTWKVRNVLREHGRSYNEIMSAEWYNLPEVEPNAEGLVPPHRNRLLPPPPTHCPSSPLCPPPSTFHLPSPGFSLPYQPPSLPSCGHYAPSPSTWLPRDQMPRREEGEGKWHVGNQLSRGKYFSNCGPSDSGVGADTWANHGSPTTANGDRLHAYIHQQNMVVTHLAERERSAQAAAITLLSNSPHPEELNPFCGSSSKHYSSFDDSLSVLNGTCVPQTQHADSNNQQCFKRYSFQETQSSVGKKSRHSCSPLAMATQQHFPERASPQSRVVTLVVYTLNQLPVPYARRLNGTDFTLKDFKEKVFGRTGKYRFFFKNLFPDFNMELFEEFSDEEAVLPVMNGKIEARVEKI